MEYCKHIYIYNKSKWKEIDVKKLINSLEKLFPYSILEEKNFICNSIEDESKLGNTLVTDLKRISKKKYRIDSANMDSSFKSSQKGINDINLIHKVYDGFILQQNYQTFLEYARLDLSHLHLIITDKLVCTFDETDWKYHGRTIVCGTPTLISTTGIVEGPAKPRDYYYKLMYYYKEKNILQRVNEEYRERFIDYGDIRINDIIIGLVMQSMCYFINSGYAFCTEKDCRIYNAHWQEDLIRINMKNWILCKKHLQILNNYNKLIKTSSSLQ